MDMILKTTDLCKEFNRQTAVRNVSLSVKRNSVYGLLGPNGAGKSTTLKMLTGMLRPTFGRIEFDGHRWERRDLARIGALIEAPPLYDNLTAGENLEVTTTMLGFPKRRIREVLETVGLTDTGKKRAGHFSMGMRQRLGIALALLNEPELLILDEPTNGLDPLGIQELLEMIKSFPQKEITVILSGKLFGSTIGGREGFCGFLLLSIASLWEIPLYMLLSSRFGMFATVFSCVVLSFCGVGGIANTNLWWLCPSAVPSRLMCPVLGILPNGLTVPAGSSLWNRNVILPGILISLSWFILLTGFVRCQFEKQSDRQRRRQSESRYGKRVLGGCPEICGRAVLYGRQEQPCKPGGARVTMKIPVKQFSC